MPVKKAVGFFTGSGGNPRLNCGQAVAQTFKEKFSLSDDFIFALESSGNGRAPGGVCGAIHAVQTILRQVDSDKADQAGKLFSEHAGSLLCSDIRRLRKVSCIGCVKKAASLLHAV